MEVTVEVAADGSHCVELAADATAADLLRAVGFSPLEATVLVDGRPIPNDAPVEAEAVTVLRLVAGGCRPPRDRGRHGPGPGVESIDDRPTPPAGVQGRTVGQTTDVEGRVAGLTIRTGRETDHSTVMAILQAALLEVTTEQVREGETLVATADGRVIGALVLDGAAIVAIAVRPGRRDAGVGSALVMAAAERRTRLVADFDDHIRPFYAGLGFRIRPGDVPGRLHGVLESSR